MNSFLAQFPEKNELIHQIINSLAQLGEALAQYKSGDAETALTTLEALAANLSATEGIRAEAAYYLAITAFSEGRTDDFKNFADQVNSLEQARQWQQRLFAYSQELK